MTYKERTQFLKENGLCTRCGKAPATPGHSTCPNCRDYAKVIYEKRKAQGKLWVQNHSEEYYAQKKEQYYERKEQGLCVLCGKPAVDGLIYCPRCRIKNREYCQKRRSKQV